jgi:hypothetical protein
MKFLLSICVALCFITNCYATDSTTVEDYQMFKTEFASLELTPISFQKNSNGRWVLAPLGVVTIVVGVFGGFAAMLASSTIDGSAPNPYWLYGGAVVGLGVTVLGVYMIKWSSDPNKQNRLTKRQKEINKVKTFDGY